MAVKHLKEKIDVALFAGQLLSESGAQYEVVVNSIKRLAKALGCDNVEIMIMPTTIVLTVTENDEFRTRIRNTAPVVPNMQKLSEVVKFCIDAEKNGTTIENAVLHLEAIAEEKPNYNIQTIGIAAGVACGGFALIFGGGFEAFLITILAAWLGFWMRNWAHKAKFHWLLVSIFASFISAAIPLLFYKLVPLGIIAIAQASAVLFLVPGILFISSVEDMLIGYFLVGFARALHATLICLGIVVGMSFAFYLQGLLT